MSNLRGALLGLTETIRMTPTQKQESTGTGSTASFRISAPPGLDPPESRAETIKPPVGSVPCPLHQKCQYCTFPCCRCDTLHVLHHVNSMSLVALLRNSGDTSVICSFLALWRQWLQYLQFTWIEEMHERCILCDFWMFLHVELFQRTFAWPCMSGRVFGRFWRRTRHVFEVKFVLTISLYFAG